MGKFLATVLAVILGFIGTMVFSHVSRSVIFKYNESREGVEDIFEWIEPKILENLWLGEALTPFVEICLIESSINLSYLGNEA
jgi:hypothetical protein